MNWFEDNPLGKALLYVSGALLLVAAVITVAWSLPVSVDESGVTAGDEGGQANIVAAREVASLNELQVINQRPVFNENRLPVIEEAEGGEEPLDATIEVKDAPDVKLTGVIITPELKIATLTPSSGTAENVMAHEGEALIGDYVGWTVAEVRPRAVALRSNDGQKLELELQVHDVAIKEPPKPIAVPVSTNDAAAQAAAENQQAPQAGEEDEPMSRAEQIRQRIAERREQLRLEQEEREAREQMQEQARGETRRANPRAAYQDAIRNLMKTKDKENEGKDQKDG